MTDHKEKNMTDHQETAQAIEVDNCITGRFIWVDGMLFFKPDKEGDSLHDLPLGLPLENFGVVNVHTAFMWCRPAKDVVSFAPEWLEGYEALCVIRPEAVSIPILEDPVERVLKKISGFLAVYASRLPADRFPVSSPPKGQEDPSDQ